MPKPLALPELAQQKHKGATTHDYTDYLKLFQLFKRQELNLKLRLKSVTEGF